MTTPVTPDDLPTAIVADARPPVGWSRVAHLVLWGIIALPALYQIGLLIEAIAGRVGYPYDLVRATYPKYFDDRKVAVTFERWWNVTEHSDFLGSNFRRDTENCDPDPTVGIGHDDTCTTPCRNLYFEPPVGGDRHARVKARSKADWIPLRRLHNHGVYWNQGVSINHPNWGWPTEAGAIMRVSKPPPGEAQEH